MSYKPIAPPTRQPLSEESPPTTPAPPNTTTPQANRAAEVSAGLFSTDWHRASVPAEGHPPHEVLFLSLFVPADSCRHILRRRRHRRVAALPSLPHGKCDTFINQIRQFNHYQCQLKTTNRACKLCLGEESSPVPRLSRGAAEVVPRLFPARHAPKSVPTRVFTRHSPKTSPFRTHATTSSSSFLTTISILPATPSRSVCGTRLHIQRAPEGASETLLHRPRARGFHHRNPNVYLGPIPYMTDKGHVHHQRRRARRCVAAPPLARRVLSAKAHMPTAPSSTRRESSHSTARGLSSPPTSTM